MQFSLDGTVVAVTGGPEGHRPGDCGAIWRLRGIGGRDRCWTGKQGVRMEQELRNAGLDVAFFPRRPITAAGLRERNRWGCRSLRRCWMC